MDSGANVFAVRDKSLLYHFIPQRLPYKDVNGGTSYSDGFGLALIRLCNGGQVYPIGPVYVNPGSPRNSFSLSALRRFCGFIDATESMLKHCKFTDHDALQTTVKCYHHNGLDFLDIEILTIDPHLSPEPPPISAQISQLTQKSRNNLSDVQKLQEAHIRLGHVNFETLIKMSKNKTMEDLPLMTKQLPIICRACFRHNRKHIPRNPSDSSRPPLMTVFSVDFVFYKWLSLRGHNCAYTIVCKGSRYPFAFPCCAKRPPISIMKFFVGCLRNLGFKPAVFKMDEGGELAKSTEFCKCLAELNLILHPTGGDNKTSNGLVERFHQTIHQMNRSTLATLKSFLPTKLPDGITIQSFWDLCLGYMVQVKRVLINRTLGESPYFIVFKRRPSYRDYPVFGSPCEIVESQPDKLVSTSRSGFFVGKGNNTGAFLVWTISNPYKILRAHHVIINDASSLSILDGTFLKDQKTDPRSTSEFDLTPKSSPFDLSEIVTYHLDTPPGLSPLGLRIIDDEDWNIPKLDNCIKDSPAYQQLKPSHRRNMHIVSIDGIEPISAQYAISLISGPRRLRSEKSRTISIQLCKRKTRSRTVYEQLRAKFDTLRPILASHQAVLPEPPKSVKFSFQAYSGQYRQNYKAATYNQFEKNASLFVYGKPILRSSLPSSAIVLTSVMAPSIKKDNSIQGLYKFKMRHTVNGGPMEQGLHFRQSFAPNCSHDSIKSTISLASAKSYKGIGIADIENAFQTIIHFSDLPDSQKYATVPQYFEQWYCERYRVKFPGQAKECVIPLFTNMQGQKDAGPLCYELILKVMMKYDLVRSPVDYGCFSKSYPEGIAYVLVSTDDFLCLFPTMPQYEKFLAHLKEYFTISFQDWPSDTLSKSKASCY